MLPLPHHATSAAAAPHQRGGGMHHSPTRNSDPSPSVTESKRGRVGPRGGSGGIVVSSQGADPASPARSKAFARITLATIARRPPDAALACVAAAPTAAASGVSERTLEAWQVPVRAKRDGTEVAAAWMRPVGNGYRRGA